MTETTADTIVHRLLRNAATSPQRIALRRKRDSGWQAFTWSEYAGLANAAARAFAERGLRPGQPVAILAGNRLEWAIAALGALTAGGVVAGVYPTLTAEQTAYVVGHSGAPIAVVEDREQLDKLRAQRAALPALAHVLVLDGDHAEDGSGWVESWDAALAAGTGGGTDEVAARVAGLRPDGLATLVYTSGTTGSPKGVMLSHDNLTWTADAVEQRLPPGLQPRLVSYLPLSHIAEQMISLYLGISLVGEVWFAESLEKLRDNLLDCRPTVFFGVPRVWEKIGSALAQRFAGAHGAKAALLRFARRTASEVWERRQRDPALPPGLALRYRVARALVLDKVRAALGLDQTRVFVSSAAPLARATIDFFASLDMPIFEVYGLSEDSGPATQNNEQHFRFGTVGRPLPGVDVRLAADGEVLIRGGNVFQGYFRDPAATAEALHDGWLQSGDVGEIDADGFLRITDRKKDLLITAGGKNVAPQPIEQRLRAIPEVSQAVVVGDRQPYLIALLTLDPAAAERWAGAAGLASTDPAALSADPALRQHVAAAIERINADLARYETVKRFAILPCELSIEGGELTPTMKIKRRVVTEKYAAQIAALYA